MKHTSGEWRYEFAKWSKEAPTNGFIIQSNGKDICGLNVKTTAHIVPKNDAFFFVDNYSIEPEEAEANAKLIAAAPELLDCVNSVIPVLERLINATPTGGYRNELCDLNIQLQSAIIKATI